MLQNNHSRRYRFLYSVVVVVVVVVVVDGVEMPAEEAVSNVVHTSFVALHYYLVAAEEDVQACHDLVVADIDMVEEPRMVLVDIAADIVAVVVVVADVEDTCPAADKEDWHAVVGMGSYC